MSKVDWYKAELEYVTKPRLSYDDIAKHFHVAKSTVVRQAKKNAWLSKRKEFQKRLYNRARITRMETAAQTNERHLNKTYMIQDMVNLETSKLIDKMTREGPLSNIELKNFFKLSSAYFDAVMMERKIKGLNIKPVQIRLSDPDDVDRYLETVGLKDPPVDQTYKKVKEAIETLDMLIERRKRLQSYIDEVDERGRY